MKKATILALCILLVTVEAFSKDYHISRSENDLNSGTISLTYGTISAAAKIALSGDGITVHEGTYRKFHSKNQMFQ